MLYFICRFSYRLELQRLAGAELHDRTIKNLKEVSRQCREIDSHVEQLKSFLKDESQRCDGIVDCMDNVVTPDNSD